MDILEPSRRLAVRTPEGVSFSFVLASPFLRMLARVIDAAVVVVALSVLGSVGGALNVIGREFANTIVIVVYFALSMGYDLACERLWRGQTVGKRLLRLRVVDATGLRLAFAQSALRVILRPVDSLPICYLVGGLTAFFSRSGQRLGDIAAGTLVIWEPSEPAPDLSSLGSDKYNSLREHPGLVARLRHGVEPAQARAAYTALQRRKDLDAEGRVELFAAFAAYFKGLTPMPVEITEGISDEQLVRNIVEVLYSSR